MFLTHSISLFDYILDVHILYAVSFKPQLYSLSKRKFPFKEILVSGVKEGIQRWCVLRLCLFAKDLGRQAFTAVF